MRFSLTTVSQLIDSPDEEKRDFDFLSSIELVVVDQADVLLMQNWEHLEVVFSHLNLIPKVQCPLCSWRAHRSSHKHGFFSSRHQKAHSSTDFSRVRTWALNGLGRHYRQSVLLSAFMSAELNALFNRLCTNSAGKVKLYRTYVQH